LRSSSTSNHHKGGRKRERERSIGTPQTIGGSKEGDALLDTPLLELLSKDVIGTGFLLGKAVFHDSLSLQALQAGTAHPIQPTPPTPSPPS